MTDNITDTADASNHNLVFECNYTGIPNVFFDYWMFRLTHVEFKVLMCIARKTFGWHKKQDNISISQIVKMNGASRQSTINALHSLEESQLIIKTLNRSDCHGNEPNTYSINVLPARESTMNDGASTMVVPPPSTVNVLPPSTMAVPTKERPKQKKNEQPPSPPSENKEKSFVGFSCLKGLGLSVGNVRRLQEGRDEAYVAEKVKVMENFSGSIDSVYGFLQRAIEEDWKPKVAVAGNSIKSEKWWRDSGCSRFEGKTIKGVMQVVRMKEGIEFLTSGANGKCEMVKFTDSGFKERIQSIFTSLKAHG